VLKKFNWVVVPKIFPANKPLLAFSKIVDRKMTITDLEILAFEIEVEY